MGALKIINLDGKQGVDSWAFLAGDMLVTNRRRGELDCGVGMSACLRYSLSINDRKTLEAAFEILD